MAAELPSVAARVVGESLEDALSTARALSEGRLSLAELRALGHPYRKGGIPPQDPAIINRQSNVFFLGWEIEPGGGGGGEGGRVVNRTPQAEWLRKGTNRMIARPTVERIEEQVEPRHQERVQRALQALFGG